MAAIQDFKDYMDEIQAQIAGINLNKMVTSEKQLSKYINDLQRDDNALMLGLMPNFGNNSPQSGDGFRLRGFTELMILEKTDFSDLTDAEYIAQSDRIFAIANLVKAKLLADHLDGDCNIMRFLDPTSIQIVDVYNNSQCNGWTVVFTFDL
ncbi:MAG TPA: hypothetical protein PKH16_10010 [Aequorivita sp.]|nr:hypothetical protein [Aequorivita sp.]